MQTISDVFAFACANPDRWEVLEADPEGDLGITNPADIGAFTAARDHVRESAITLLKATWSRCNARAMASRTTRYDGLTGREPDRRTLLRDLSWERLIVKTKGKELFVGASIEMTGDDGPRALYAWLRMPEEHMDAWTEAITGSSIRGGRYDDYYYLPTVDIRAGAVIDDLAEMLAEQLWPALQKASKMLSPDRRKASTSRDTAQSTVAQATPPAAERGSGAAPQARRRKT